MDRENRTFALPRAYDGDCIELMRWAFRTKTDGKERRALFGIRNAWCLFEMCLLVQPGKGPACNVYNNQPTHILSKSGVRDLGPGLLR